MNHELLHWASTVRESSLGRWEATSRLRPNFRPSFAIFSKTSRGALLAFQAGVSGTVVVCLFQHEYDRKLSPFGIALGTINSKTSLPNSAVNVFEHFGRQLAL